MLSNAKMDKYTVKMHIYAIKIAQTHYKCVKFHHILLLFPFFSYFCF